MPYHKVLLWISLVLSISAAVAAPAWAIKPRPPLQLFLQETSLDGGQNRLTMSATANVDLSRVALSIELPPGLSLIEGAEGWEGAMKRGETKQLEWIVQSPNQTPRKVIGKATVELSTGENVLERATVVINEAKENAPLRTPSIKRKEGGETILEFKGK